MSANLVNLATMIATAVSAVAMVLAAVFAWLAWRADRGRAAAQRVDAYVVSLTTGALSHARNKISAWNRTVRGEAGPTDANSVTDARDRDMLRCVLEVLWALQRSASMDGDLEVIDESSRETFVYHLGLIVRELNDFAALLGPDGVAAVSQSARAANDSLRIVHARVPRCVNDDEWAYELHGFSGR